VSPPFMHVSDNTAIVICILVPLDLHRWSEAKLPVVRASAQAFDAQIILLQVRPPERAAGAAVSVSETQARTYLDAIATRLHGDGLNAHPLVRWGQAADTILNEIEEQHADLVILGSTVRPGLSRLWLGSVAAEVVAKASCPVLLVRPPDGRVTAASAVRSFAEDAARSGPVVPRPLGARTVEIARIIGRVGRAAELDARFRPQAHRRSDEQRFERVRTLLQGGAALWARSGVP
jgi:nucleotide-binding universal stress UspA family protein